MDPSLIYLLVALAVWAAVLFYVFILRRTPDLFASGKSALLILTAHLIPVLAYTLWSQSRAQDRLEALGFSLHPGLTNSVGVVTGIGKSPTWLYDLDAPADTVLEFYSNPDHHQGWQLLATGASGLQIQRGTETMSLQVGDDQVVFLLTKPD